MIPDTRLARQLQQLERLPANHLLATALLRRSVPFLGTAGVRFVSAEPGSATLALDDRRRVHNHVRGVHAGAAALLAEATSGLVLAYHLPDSALFLLSHLDIAYRSRMQGGLVATARIDDETRSRAAAEARGETTIEVDVRDEAGSAPLVARLTWVWRPKKRAGRQGDLGDSNEGQRVSPR